MKTVLEVEQSVWLALLGHSDANCSGQASILPSDCCAVIQSAHQPTKIRSATLIHRLMRSYQVANKDIDQ